MREPLNMACLQAVSGGGRLVRSQVRPLTALDGCRQLSPSEQALRNSRSQALVPFSSALDHFSGGRGVVAPLGEAA